jgi:outer membrane protein assembly factor BamB
MNKIITIIIILLISHCSFDSKTGIWKGNEKKITENVKFKDFVNLSNRKNSFNSVIEPPNNLSLKLDSFVTPKKWLDRYYQNTNNQENFNYKSLNQLIYKSKKLSKYIINENILFDGENFIISDEKGNIIIFSLEQKKTILKYNFYKKKYKISKKILKITAKENILYVSDNLGYVYALDYLNNKILWAKNFQIPFRSNIKISNNIIIVSDQNNSLYFLNKFDGSKTRVVPTEDMTLKNNFINSIAISTNSFLFLNTYGSLYSFDSEDLKINWFINLNQSFDLNPANLFYSNPIVIKNNYIIISSDLYLHIVNKDTGQLLIKYPISSIVTPIISGENIFIITKDNLLVSINLKKKEVIYSLDISKEIGNFLKTKNKPINIKNLSLVNNNLYVYLDNSYFVKFNINGKIKNINKLPQKIYEYPIFVDQNLLYLNNKNKLIVLN